MKQLERFTLLIALGFCFSLNATAYAETLCLKNRAKVSSSGFINLKKSIRIVPEATCPKKFERLLSIDATMAGFAAIDAGTDTLRNIGGTYVTSASVGKVAPGSWVVTFNGTFPGLTDTDSTANRDLISVLASAENFDNGVSTANVTSATSSVIQILVFRFKSDTREPQDRDSFVSFLIGS